MKHSMKHQVSPPSSANGDMPTSSTNWNVPFNNSPTRAYTRKELLDLLAYFEGELQARDIALQVLKFDQRASGGNDRKRHMMKSLEKDVLNLAVVDESEAYAQLYHNNFRQLNRLVEVQKEAQKRFAERMLEVEDQHARQLFELYEKLEQTEKSVDKTKQGLCSILEERINSLKAECARKQQELDRLDAELHNRDCDAEAEKERHKTIVLFLLAERKHLLSVIHQMQLKMKNNIADNESLSPSVKVIAELKKQLRSVSEERNCFSQQCSTLQAERINMMKVIHNLEEDIMSLKANLYIDKPTEIGISGCVVANKAALSTELPTKFAETSNTGTVRFNKAKGALLPTSKSGFEMTFQQQNLINGNISQKTNIPGDTVVESNLPRPSIVSTSRQPPSMGVRGSQLRNTRPAMGVSAQSESQHYVHPVSYTTTAQFPTTAADMSGGPYMSLQQQQLRMVPVNHQGPSTATSAMAAQATTSVDGRLTKRSTSLPRKMSNESINPAAGKSLTTGASHPLSPSKIRLPSANHEFQATVSNPQAKPSSRFTQKTSPSYQHTHIS